MRKLKVAHVKISQNRKGTCDEKIRRNFISTSRPDVIKKLSQFYRKKSPKSSLITNHSVSSPNPHRTTRPSGPTPFRRKRSKPPTRQA